MRGISFTTATNRHFSLTECLDHSTHRTSYLCAPNDIWSLGVILVNLTCGRNPWKEACYSDSTYRAYLRDPSFLKTILPITDDLNNILRKIFHPDPAQRITLPQLVREIAACRQFTRPAQPTPTIIAPPVTELTLDEDTSVDHDSPDSPMSDDDSDYSDPDYHSDDDSDLRSRPGSPLDGVDPEDRELFSTTSDCLPSPLPSPPPAPTQFQAPASTPVVLTTAKQPNQLRLPHTGCFPQDIQYQIPPTPTSQLHPNLVHRYHQQLAWVCNQYIAPVAATPFHYPPFSFMSTC